ncbi:MAG: alanine racemase [Coriobacteriia bacterium]|nr:alanine racemase [Coriobacteriia bacterium]
MTDRRWAWTEIDLAAFGRNVRTLKAKTRPGTGFMAVVKADGYGNGAVRVARAAVSAGADRLGVATVDEALELRSAGLRAPLQLLSEPPVSAIPALLAKDVIPAVTTREFASALSARALSGGARAHYHLKVDSGMNRSGVRAEDVAEFARWQSGLGGLALEGTFTHLATADVPGDWEVRRQLERFTDALEVMRTEGVDPGIVHAANSAGTILWPDAHFDMVRCGIALYGLHPAPSTYKHIELEPILTLKARLSLVKRIGVGESVSYGFTWTAAAPTTVATLPLGYADGIHRVLSNNMEVLIGGVRCRQIGRVCMDQLMVEVPRGVSAEMGDEAVIVGRQGRGQIMLDDLAERAGTINYELSCAFGARLERVYV